MEVHRHSHTESLPAGKAGKRWTHYFCEFLMLFLDVLYRKLATEAFHPAIFNDIVAADNAIRRPSNKPSVLTYDSKTY